MADSTTAGSAPATSGLANNLTNPNSSTTVDNKTGGKVDVKSGNASGDALNKTNAKTDDKGNEPVVPEWKKVKHKVKVDDVETEVDYDELVKNYQLKSASMKRMQEASKEKDLAKEVMKYLENNPREALTKAGIDALKIANAILREESDERLLTPAQKEKREYERQIKELKDAQNAEKTKADQAEFDKHYAAYSEKLNKQVTEAINSVGLPPTPEVAKRMGSLMLAYKKAGWKDVTPSDVAAELKKDIKDLVDNLTKTSSDDQLLALLGDKAEGVIRAKAAKVQGKNPDRTVDPKVNANKQGNSPKPKVDPDTFFRQQREQHGITW